jgi:hypothetical protein
MPAVHVTHRRTGTTQTSRTVYDHYVGIDWSVKTMAIAHMTHDDEHPRVFERPADIKQLKLYLQSLVGRVIITFEESGAAHWLYLELVEMVERILICDPFRNSLLVHGPKTDKLDAGKLCALLRAGLLHEVFHSDSTLYELRLLASGYDDVVRAGIRILNQKQALTLAHRDSGTTSDFVTGILNEQIDLYRRSKRQYEQRFAEIARRNILVRHQKELPGIGLRGAVRIVAVVVDAHRFPMHAMQSPATLRASASACSRAVHATTPTNLFGAKPSTGCTISESEGAFKDVIAHPAILG